MMKKLAILLTLLLVVSSFAIAGCGRVYSSNPMPIARTVPHSVDAPFQNCNVCHNADQLAAVIPHKDFDKDTTAGNCLQKGACHGGLPTQPPQTTTPKPTATQPTATSTQPTATQPTATSTSTPTKTGGGTGAGTGAGTGGGAPALTKAPLAIEIATHPAAYAALCGMCHTDAPGPNQYPIPPTWAGSAKSPGPWTVTAGSPADHTGRVDTAACVAAGCHAKPW